MHTGGQLHLALQTWQHNQGPTSYVCVTGLPHQGSKPEQSFHITMLKENSTKPATPTKNTDY